MDFESRLRANEHRVTATRRAVWSALAASTRHLTAHELAEIVARHDPTVNLSSIYRTLSLFERLDLVRETKLGSDATSRWELTHPDDAIHLVCTSCHNVEHHTGEFVARLGEHLELHHGFLPRSTEVTVSGLCPSCRS